MHAKAWLNNVWAISLDIVLLPQARSEHRKDQQKHIEHLSVVLSSGSGEITADSPGGVAKPFWFLT